MQSNNFSEFTNENIIKKVSLLEAPFSLSQEQGSTFFLESYFRRLANNSGEEVEKQSTGCSLLIPSRVHKVSCSESRNKEIDQIRKITRGGCDVHTSGKRSPKGREEILLGIKRDEDEDEDLKEDVYLKLGERIRAGKLVSFPTETVYGIGANALDKNAVLSIFQLKNRPLTDPVISHVLDMNQAIGEILDVSSQLERRLLFHLAKNFWPGSLSIITKAKSSIPLELTAFTGLAAVRCPRNLQALKLIQASGVPIAAPSANKFGHISPTSAFHVLSEFPFNDLDIIDGGQCAVGLESTVILLENIRDEFLHTTNEKSCLEANTFDTKSSFITECNHKNTLDSLSSCKMQLHPAICVLRRGCITKQHIENCLQMESFDGGSSFSFIKVYISPKIEFKQNSYASFTFSSSSSVSAPSSSSVSAPSSSSVSPPSSVSSSSSSAIFSSAYSSVCLPASSASSSFSYESSSCETNEKNSNNPESKNNGFYLASSSSCVSPGMLLMHYSPYVPTFLIKFFCNSCLSSNFSMNSIDTNSFPSGLNVEECILIDVNNTFENYKTKFLSYSNLFSAKCEEEIIAGANKLFDFLRIAEFLGLEYCASAILICDFDCNSYGELSKAIYDRIFRAASGKVLHAKENNGVLEITDSINSEE